MDQPRSILLFFGTPNDSTTGWKPLNVAEYESHAQLNMKKGEFDYFAGGANDMKTLTENR